MLTLMQHNKPPAEVLRERVGDIEGIELFNTQILVAIYIRPEQTKGGILLPDTVTEEDRYQGKVGLLLRKGSAAFSDPSGRWFAGEEFKEGDWLVFRPSEGMPITINKQMCRLMDDVAVRGRVSQPDMVW